MKIHKILILILFTLVSSGLFSQNIPNVIPKKKQTESFKSSRSSKKDSNKPNKKAQVKKDLKKISDKKKKQTSSQNKSKLTKKSKENKKSIKLQNVKTQKNNQNIPIIDNNQENPSEKINYSEKGIFEVGGIIWGEFKALRGAELDQKLWANFFVHYFAMDYFLTGFRADTEYSFTTSTYTATGYLVVGGGFPISENLFMILNVNVGYSKNNNASSNSLFSYGNEVGVKIKLKKHFLIGISAVYSFYTDFSQEYFNDKIKGIIAFSGYF